MSFTQKTWTNPSPKTPPPSVPGTKSSLNYYNYIKGYPLTTIDISHYPPKKNESISQYRSRLVQIINNGKD